MRRHLRRSSFELAKSWQLSGVSRLRRMKVRPTPRCWNLEKFATIRGVAESETKNEGLAPRGLRIEGFSLRCVEWSKSEKKNKGLAPLYPPALRNGSGRSPGGGPASAAAGWESALTSACDSDHSIRRIVSPLPFSVARVKGITCPSPPITAISRTRSCMSP